MSEMTDIAAQICPVIQVLADKTQDLNALVQEVRALEIAVIELQHRVVLLPSDAAKSTGDDIGHFEIQLGYTISTVRDIGSHLTNMLLQDHILKATIRQVEDTLKEVIPRAKLLKEHLDKVATIEE
jgi:regulator of replication initiation timing